MRRKLEKHRGKDLHGRWHVRKTRIREHRRSRIHGAYGSRQGSGQAITDRLPFQNEKALCRIRLYERDGLYGCLSLCLQYRCSLYSGVSRFDSVTATLYSLAAIVIGLIVFASVSLIYNAFSLPYRKEQSSSVCFPRWAPPKNSCEEWYCLRRWRSVPSVSRLVLLSESAASA